MRNIDKYKGIFPAFYACYNKAGEISQGAARALTRYFVEKGVKGVYVGGSSGECIYQSTAERRLLLESVMEEAGGRLTVIVHVACNNTADSCELAAHAESLGADAIAAIPPIYFKLPEYSIADYWNDISAAAPHTDFFIYNIPQLAGIALTGELYRTMLRNPRVTGVKNSSMPGADIGLFKAIGGRDRIVFNGPDEQFVAGRIMGADGGIGGTYAVMPELFLLADQYFRSGKVEQASRLQSAVNEIIYAMGVCHGHRYGVAKEILRRRNNVDIGGVRRPLTDITPDDMMQIEHCIGLIDKALKEFVPADKLV